MDCAACMLAASAGGSRRGHALRPKDDGASRSDATFAAGGMRRSEAGEASASCVRASRVSCPLRDDVPAPRCQLSTPAARPLAARPALWQCGATNFFETHNAAEAD